MIKLNAIWFLSVAFIIVAACGGGGGGDGSIKSDVSVQIIGKVDTQQTTQTSSEPSTSTTSTTSVEGSTVQVVSFTGQEVSTATVGSDGKYAATVPSNAVYSLKVAKGGSAKVANGMVMKSLVKVENTFVIADVNPGSSAVVAVYQKKLNATIGEVGTAFKTAVENVDIVTTTNSIYNAKDYGNLASAVKQVVVSSNNPFIDSTVGSWAQIVANEISITNLSTASTNSSGTSTTGTTFIGSCSTSNATQGLSLCLESACSGYSASMLSMTTSNSQSACSSGTNSGITSVWSTTAACPTTNSVGYCESGSSSGSITFTSKLHYYSPLWTAAQAQKNCAGGVWHP